MTWQDGDVDPKAMLIVIYDNDVYELTKASRLWFINLRRDIS